MILLKQSSTAQALEFFMTDSADHLTGKTGLSPTVTLRKSNASAAGSFGSPAGTVRELGNGWYQVDGNATDTNTLGPLILHATATGADPADKEYGVVAFDPQTVSMGLVLAKTTNITGFNDIAAADVWSVGTRLLTAGTNIVLAKGTGITGFNDIAATAIVSGGAITTSGGAVSTVTTLTNAPQNSAGVTTLLTRIGGTLTISGGAVDANQVSVNGIPITLQTTDDLADGILDRADAIATGWNLRKTLAGVGSVLLGEISGGGTSTEVFRDLADSKNAVTVTVDASGNRSVFVYSLP